MTTRRMATRRMATRATAIGVLFPGQGCQRAGMLARLQEASPASRGLIEEARALLPRATMARIEGGTQEEVTETQTAQVAILVASLCHWRHLVSERPALAGGALVMAGHSLGEYSALAAGGRLPLAEALHLVAVRARCMSRPAASGGDGEAPQRGLMASVTVGRSEDYEAACGWVAMRLRQAYDRVAIAAYNSSHQLVVSGDAAQVRQIVKAFPEEGRAAGLSAVRLLPHVSDAFHAPLMASAAAAFAAEAAPLLRRLGGAGWAAKEAQATIMSNVTGEAVGSAPRAPPLRPHAHV